MGLRTEGLTVRYGGVQAVAELSIDVGDGEIVGLIGPNGAGKTTCIDAMSGFVAYDGHVWLDGEPIDGAPPHRRVRRGLARTFQSVELFDDLDVAANLLVAAERRRWWRPVADLVAPGRTKPDAPALERAVDLAGIDHLLARGTDELSEGERKLVGLGRALASDPRVLLLDEPAAGLDTAESLELAGRLRAVAAGGVSLLLVDHDMELVLSTCDRVHVVDAGRLLASGPPDEVCRDDRVVAAYLGAPVAVPA
jgi:branched-chain amino acid transport system ATP-binding protein